MKRVVPLVLMLLCVRMWVGLQVRVEVGVSEEVEKHVVLCVVVNRRDEVVQRESVVVVGVAVAVVVVVVVVVVVARVIVLVAAVVVVSSIAGSVGQLCHIHSFLSLLLFFPLLFFLHHPHHAFLLAFHMKWCT